MKKLFVFIITALFALSVQGADGNQVKVKLKSGATVTGVMKRIDPLKEIVIVIAGQETTISMSDVENVEMVEGFPTAQSQVVPAADAASNATSNVAAGKRKLTVTEPQDYAKKITLKIGGLNHEMILVPGGQMNMGYDGEGSMSMKSEPIHEVIVTTFYISTAPLPASLVTSLVTSKDIKGIGNEPAQVLTFQDVERLISSVAFTTNLPLRLPTEAEWEYAASSDQQDALFSDIARSEQVAYEWCGDYWGKFGDDMNLQTDPTGPLRGKERVIRSYNGKKGKYDRSNSVSGNSLQGLVRLAIKAKDVK